MTLKLCFDGRVCRYVPLIEISAWILVVGIGLKLLIFADLFLCTFMDPGFIAPRQFRQRPNNNITDTIDRAASEEIEGPSVYLLGLKLFLLGDFCVFFYSFV